MEDDPPSKKCKISQQPLVRSFSNFKLKLMAPNQSVQTPMEDDLKIFNVEYLSNHWSYLTKIVNLS